MPIENNNQQILHPRTVLRIGFWNIRTLREKGKSALIALEMDRYKLDILGLSEVRWTSSGEVKLATGHLLLYSGHTNEDNIHEHGVGVLLGKKGQKSLMEWEAINERIMTARFHGRFRNVTIIQCYAPTNNAEEGTKEQFYNKLQHTIDKQPKGDIKVLMGDLNAKVGNDNTG